MPFDFKALQEGLEAQSERRDARQVAQAASARTEVNLANRSAKLAKDYDKTLNPLRQSVKTSQQRANEARLLADSNNPIDTLRLIGLQYSQPQHYTREGRQKRLAEDMQRASAISHAYGVSQGALDRELLASQVGLKEAEIIETIGLERLTAIQDEAAIAAENLKAHITLQETAMHGLDSRQLSAALQEATSTGNDVANINGLDVDIESIRTRIDAVEQRTHERLLRGVIRQLEADQFSPESTQHEIRKRAYTRTLEADEMANVDHELGVRRYNRALESDTVGALDHELKKRDAQRTLEADEYNALETNRLIRKGQRNAEVETVIRDSQKKELQTYDMNELLTLRSNGYTSETGETFNPEDVDSMYTRKVQTQSDRISQTMTRNALNNFDTSLLAAEKNRLDSLKSKLPENSPLSQAVRNYEAALGIASLGSGQDAPFETRMVSFATYQQAKESFEKTVESQAKAEAKGDKNLEQLRLAFYQNQPLPQDALFNAVSDRLDKGRSLADIFPPQIEIQLKQNYRDIYQQKLSETNGSILGGSTTAEDRRLMKQEAIQQALDQVVTNNLDTTSEELISNQVLHPEHPLHGRFTPQQMNSAVRGADARAFDEWQRGNKLSPEEAMAIRNGTALPQGSNVSPDMTVGLLEKLRVLENDHLMMELNGIEPRVGSRVANWWQKHGQEFIAFQRDQRESGTKSFQDEVFQSVAGQIETSALRDYGVGFVEASAAIKERHAQRFTDFVTYGSNPTNLQVMMLHNDSNLSPEEKQRVFSEVIAPMIGEAQQLGLDYKGTNLFIERNLMDIEPESKELGRILKTMNRERSRIAEQMNDWNWVGRVLLGFDSEVPSPEQAKISWYLEWQKQNQMAKER